MKCQSDPLKDFLGIIDALLTLETRLSPDFGRFLTTLGILRAVLVQAFSLGHQIFLRKNSSMYILSRVLRFFHDIKL